MFEQAVLPSHPAGKRYWTVAAGFTGELLGIGGLLLAPLIWPELLPRTQVLTRISLPAPPPPVLKEPPPIHTNAFRPLHPSLSLPVTPIIADRIPITIEAPPDDASRVGVQAAVPGGTASPFLDLFPAIVRVVPPEQPVARPVVSQPPKAPPAEPRRISALHPARLLHRVEPIYPKIAVAARIEGTVELAGVIATDGRIRELRLISGHPMLAKAALDAVRQWIYEPTVLNGEPVEVAAPIQVRFVLH
jgi:periplasmic protein TonB